jgi:hypothetical protein
MDTRRRRDGDGLREITAVLDELEVRFLLDPETRFDDRVEGPESPSTPSPEPPMTRPCPGGYPTRPTTT